MAQKPLTNVPFFGVFIGMGVNWFPEFDSDVGRDMQVLNTGKMAVLPPDPVFCFKSDMGYIHSICFTVKSHNYVSHILAATEKGTVYFWDLETNRLQHKQQMGESIQAIHSFEDKIITQEKSGSVHLWSVENKAYEIIETYECSMGYCKSIIINDALIVPQENEAVDVLDKTSLKLIKRLLPEKEKLGHVMCLERVSIGEKTYVIAGYETGDIILWDLETSKPCGHLKLQEHVTSLTFDPETCRAVCGNASNVLQLFTIDKSSFNMDLKCELSITNEGCNVVKLRPDRKLLVSGGWDGRLRLFSWKTLRLLVVLTEHTAAITDVQFSPCPVNYWNSNIIAASGADGTISLWNLYN